MFIVYIQVMVVFFFIHWNNSSQLWKTKSSWIKNVFWSYKKIIHSFFETSTFISFFAAALHQSKANFKNDYEIFALTQQTLGFIFCFSAQKHYPTPLCKCFAWREFQIVFCSHYIQFILMGKKIAANQFSRPSFEWGWERNFHTILK